MGSRLHVATVYKCRYGKTEAFTDHEDVFENLLNILDVPYVGESFYSNFEITKEDWTRMINTLKNIEAVEEPKKSQILEYVRELDYCSIDKAIRLMERLLKEADPNNDYLVLTFF